MVNVDLIKSKLPQELREKAQEFSIPDKFIEEMPEVIVLVLNSKSMDNQEEKQSWFNLLPLMNKEQTDKLIDILTREKQKLEEIEKKYEQKKTELKNKYTQKWDDIVYSKKIEDIKKQEAELDKIEDQEVEHLLTQI